MATREVASNPRLESLLQSNHSNSNSEEEEDLSLKWGNNREGLSFVIDLPQRMFAYLFYLITFSFISSVVSKKSRKTYIICIVCEVICQIISLALMVVTVVLRTSFLIVPTFFNNTCRLFSNQASSTESTEVYVYLWEVGYDIISLSSLIYLFYYSHTSRNGITPHRLIMSTRKNRTSVWKSQNSEFVRNSVRNSIKFKPTASCRSAFTMLWQCVLTILLVLTLAAEGNSIQCEIERHWPDSVCRIYEVIRAINSPQRYLSPVIVCLLCRVAYTKLETDFKLNSVSTFTNLIISPNTAWIKERYFEIVSTVNEYCDKFRAIIALNIMCSLLGMGSIIIVRLFFEEGNLQKELWQLEAHVLLKLYATYFILISCTWLVIDGISGFTDLFSRFPDELMGFILSQKLDLVNQTELNIIAISAKGTQGYLYTSQFLATLRYTLIIGLVALIVIALEGSIVYRVSKDIQWCIKNK